MRTLLLIALLLNAALLAVHLIVDAPARAVRAAPVGAAATVKNGDCDGDGQRSLTDAVVLLEYLFLGGSEPVALANEPALSPEQAEILSLLSIVELPAGDGAPPARTIRIAGANLQIVNGMGNTETTNGLGNLIVGYQETRGAAGDLRDFRTGSHNVVIGRRHSFRSAGGLVAGEANTLLGDFSAVTGGMGGTAAGTASSVGGGINNSATGNYSSVGGGYQRTTVRDANWRAGSLAETQ